MRTGRAVLRLAAVAALALGVVAATGAAGPAISTSPAPSGFTILANNLTCQVARIDLGTGAVTPIGAPQPLAVCPSTIVHAPDGRYLGITIRLTGPSQLVQIDVNTGVITPIGPTSFTATDAGGLVFAPGGALLFYGIVSDPACSASMTSCLYRIDPATGASTLIGSAGNNIEVSAVTVACDGRLLAEWEDFTFILGSSGAPPARFLPQGASTATTTTTTDAPPSSSSPPPTGSGNVTPATTTGAVSFGTVDPGTGALTRIGPPSGTQAVDGMDTASDGSLWGVGVRDLNATPRIWNTVTIDPSTGGSTEEALVSINGRTQSVAGLELDATCPVAPTAAFTG